jgi:hypothetical protein
MELHEEEDANKPGSSSSFSSPSLSLSTLETSYPKLSYSLESSFFTCVLYK